MDVAETTEAGSRIVTISISVSTGPSQENKAHSLISLLGKKIYVTLYVVLSSGSD